MVLDSPMAASATEIMVKYSDYTLVDRQKWTDIVEKIYITKDYTETQEIIAEKQSKIVIAGSGMITGGRVLEYLKHYIGDSRNTVLIVGFQAEGTRGRALLNQSHELKMHGKYYDVKAHIAEITGLSAHADQSELIDWVKNMKFLPSRSCLFTENLLRWRPSG